MPTVSNEQKTQLLPEYSEACASLRHYSSLRFVQFSVFFALVAGLITISFDMGSPVNTKLFLPVRIAALFLTIIFWTLEERWSQLAEYYTKRASELEKQMGFNTHANRPLVGFLFFKVRFVIVTRLLYLGIAIFWLSAIFVL